MTRIKLIGTTVCLMLAMSLSTAFAIPTNTQVEFLVNGSSQSTAGIDAATGLGTRTFSFTSADTYDVRSFFDLDLSLATTGFSNEYGVAYNNADSRMSWEIDEPGYFVGNLYKHFNGSGFDGTIGTNDYATEKIPDDVAVGIGWNFVLDPGFKATLNFTASGAQTFDPLMFYIGQYEAYGSNDPVYFYSSLLIEPISGPTVPEPSTIVLLGSALVGLSIYSRKRRNG